MSRRDVTRDAPVRPFDYPYKISSGEQITACHECLPWSVEVYEERLDIVVREWHAYDCPIFDEES